MTKTMKEFYNEMLNMYDLTAEHREFIQGRIDALNKKAANRKPTETQTENEKLRAKIVEFLIANPASSAAVIRTELGLSSPQKTSALLKQLMNEGAVTATIEKKISYYSAVEVE